MNRTLRALRPIIPIVLALIAGALVLAAIGKNPFAFYAEVVQFGLLGTGWQNSLVLMTPLMLVALGLIVAFRAGLWNLGFDAQYLLSAVLVAGLGTSLVDVWPLWLLIPTLFVVAVLVGAVWTLIPAWLKVRSNTNEIVTTLVMSFIGIGVANLLIKGPFQDPGVLVPQTRVLPQDALLAYIPGTRIHIGLILALVIVVVGHFVLTRTSLGVRIDVFGASVRTARSVGIRTGVLTVLVFALSGGIVALAGAVDMLGLWGYARTGFNPAYGLAVIPFVLMARLNVLGTLPLLAFYAVFATGTTIAAQHAEISVDLVVIMVAFILGFLALSEWMFARIERRPSRG